MNISPEISPIDGTMHLQNILLLQGAQAATNLTELRARCPFAFDATDQYNFVDSTPTLPRTTIVTDQYHTRLMVILNGMQGFDKVAALLYNWSLSQPRANGLLSPYEDAASQLLPNLFTPPAGQKWQSIRVIGHSYGGAVALYLGGMIKEFNSGTDIKIYTYGAPKPGITASWRRDITSNTRRMFLVQDPVPLLPLRSENLSTLWTVVGVPTARLWSRWRQPLSGLGLLFDGSVFPLDEPNFTNSFGLVTSVGQWLIGSDCFGSSRHTLQAYFDAVTPMPAVNFPSQYPSTHSVPNDRHTPTERQLVLQQATALAQAGELTQSNPQAAVQAIVSGVQIVAKERFRGALWGGVNAVYYNGEVVQITKTRRLRRALVRTLNRLLIDRVGR